LIEINPTTEADGNGTLSGKTGGYCMRDVARSTARAAGSRIVLLIKILIYFSVAIIILIITNLGHGTCASQTDLGSADTFIFSTEAFSLAEAARGRNKIFIDGAITILINTVAIILLKRRPNRALVFTSRLDELIAIEKTLIAGLKDAGALHAAGLGVGQKTKGSTATAVVIVAA
jgi:hypothetical protein